MHVRLFIIATIVAVAVPSRSDCHAQAPRPNILFILTDDQSLTTLGCYGGTAVPTPNLDRLAGEGVRFAAAYVMPQCTPTRAAFLTGQHTARQGMWHVIPWYGTPWAPVAEPAFREELPRDAFTLPKGLRAAGYATGIIGKWHLTTNEDGRYDALLPAAAAFYGFDDAAAPPRTSPNEGDKHVDLYTQQALEFIAAHREQPWFLYLAHHTLHGVVSAPQARIDRRLGLGAPAEGLHNATYLAAIEHLDASIGRLMAGLDELGEASETVVVFLSDNGGVDTLYKVGSVAVDASRPPRLEVQKREFSNAPWRAGKGSPYEGGIRVPCLVRWPGHVTPGSVCETPVHVVDWMPTLFEMAGAGAPAGYPTDGTSLVSLLEGQTMPDRALYWFLPLYDLRWGATPCAVMREGNWKLIDYFGDRVDGAGAYHEGACRELYDLRADPYERDNLAPAQPERTDRMARALDQWFQDMGVERPGPNPRRDDGRLLTETRVKPK